MKKIIVLGKIKELINKSDEPMLEELLNDDLDDNLEYYLSEERIGYGNFITYEDKKLIIDTKGKELKEVIETLQGISNLVTWAYDGYSTEQEEEAREYWDELGLGGDDDVDYNSSYLDPILDIIDIYFNLNIKLDWEKMEQEEEERKRLWNDFQALNQL